jgi:hypothetical protein
LILHFNRLANSSHVTFCSFWVLGS